MPSNEALRRWLEQVATSAAPLGEAASVAMGLPDITCAYLITLINGILLRVAMRTALTGMTSAEAQAYSDLQVLRARIVAACNETQAEPPATGEALPETPDPAPPDTPTPVEHPPEPPTVEVVEAPAPPGCCDVHGHQMPTLDFRPLALAADARGLRVGGSVACEHPCAFASWALKLVAVDASGRHVEIYGTVNRVGSASKRVSLSLPSSTLRGYRSGYVEFEAESTCGTGNRAVRSNHGWVVKPGSPTMP